MSMPSIPGIEGVEGVAVMPDMPGMLTVALTAAEAVGINMVIVPMESMMIMSCFCRDVEACNRTRISSLTSSHYSNPLIPDRRTEVQRATRGKKVNKKARATGSFNVK